MWLAFIATFIFLRFLTYAIRYHWLPIGNVVTKNGLHIHHFVWGIFTLLLVGFLGITINSPRLHAWLALAFGIGAALVLDEFALWLNLKDVYWRREGSDSVHLVILVASLLGLYYAADRFWRQALWELRAAVRLAVAGQRRMLRRRRS